MAKKANKKIHEIILVFSVIFPVFVKKHHKGILDNTSVADLHDFDGNPDPDLHFDADADPDPSFQFDADPDQGPTTHCPPDLALQCSKMTL